MKILQSVMFKWMSSLMGSVKRMFRASTRTYRNKLTLQSSISFVIASTGARDDLLDQVVIPSILNQCIKEFEIVIVGCYQGQYIHKPNIKYVPVKEFPVYFYKPFQKGVEAARYSWIVHLDDDMSLEADWYRHLLGCSRIRSDIYGFKLLNPDGSVYGDLFDTFGKPQQDNKIRKTTYFGSYIARKNIYKTEPYPTFMSGDSYHAFLISRKGFKKSHLHEVCVIHHGIKEKADSLQKAGPDCFQRTKSLRKRLGMFVSTNNPSYPHKMKKWWAYAHKLEKKHKHIGILGWFGHENAGDELILNNMLKIFNLHEVSVYTDQPKKVRTIHNVRNAFHYRNISSHLHKLDLLLVGGGGILHDRYIKQILPPSALISSKSTPIIVYAAGIPFFNWCNEIRYFLENCYLVSLRDKLCVEFFKGYCPEIPSQLLPDPGFLTPISNYSKLQGKIALNIRLIPKGWNLNLPSDVNEILIKELDLLYCYLLKRGYEPVILGFEPKDVEWMEKNDYNAKIVDFNTAIEEIASSEFLIGTRYHSGIIAATQNTPSIIINYQQKVKGLMTLLPDAISIVDIKGLDLVSLFEESFVERRNTYNFDMVEKLRSNINAFNNIYIDHRI